MKNIRSNGNGSTKLEIEERHQKRYHESLIQWIWQHTAFEPFKLQTTCGKELQILNSGQLNHGAGPDFLNATVKIDGLQWHGSVEIHNSSSEWNRHGHQHDPVYDNVVLHVVYEDENCRVKRSDGSEPYCLELKNYMSQPLNELVRFKNTESAIPCSGKRVFIHQGAFEKQIRRVSLEYFEYKADELMAEYDSAGKVSESWKNALVIQVYGMLGVSANVSQMKKLAQRLVASNTFFERMDLSQFKQFVYEKSFSENDPGERIDWVTSGMRPASRPEVRVQQAAAIHYFLMSRTLDFFSDDPEGSWKRLVNEVPREYRPGSERLNLIKNTVYLPAIYLLGRLLHSKSLMTSAYNVWINGTHLIPNEMIKPFKDAGFLIKGEARSLGLVHQFKRYCNRQRCFDCELFKNAIRS